MNDKPILMQPDMIRATLREIEQPGTGKTQTRRIVNFDRKTKPEGFNSWQIEGEDIGSCPYGQAGDRLWVREAFHYCTGCGSLPNYLDYKADTLQICGKWKPSIHMPRWASRITLDINNIRVERVQDISEADARAEGPDWDNGKGSFHKTARMAFWQLWQSINGAESWDANPWVWVIDFTPHLCNIDAMPQQEAA